MIDAALARWLKPKHIDNIVSGKGPCRVAFFVDQVRAPWSWIQHYDPWFLPPQVGAVLFMVVFFTFALLSVVWRDVGQRFLYRRHCFYSGGAEGLAELRKRWSRRSVRDVVFVPLTKENMHNALRASNSVPGLVAPVRHIAGLPRGMYVDGGVGTLMCNVAMAPGHHGLVVGHKRRVTRTYYDSLMPWRHLPARWLHRRRGGDDDKRRGLSVAFPTDACRAKFAAITGGHSRLPDIPDWIFMGNATRLKKWALISRFSRDHWPEGHELEHM